MAGDYAPHRGWDVIRVFNNAQSEWTLFIVEQENERQGSPSKEQ